MERLHRRRREDERDARDRAGTSSAGPLPDIDAVRAAALDPGMVLSLQRSMGNCAVASIVSPAGRSSVAVARAPQRSGCPDSRQQALARCVQRRASSRQADDAALLETESATVDPETSQLATGETRAEAVGGVLMRRPRRSALKDKRKRKRKLKHKARRRRRRKHRHHWHRHHWRRRRHRHRRRVPGRAGRGQAGRGQAGRGQAGSGQAVPEEVAPEQQGPVSGLRAKVLEIAETCRQNSTKDSNYYYYSQPGRWKWDVFQRDPRPVGTVRSDCSQWVIGVYYKAGCQLPGSMRGMGYTGTLLTVGKRTTTPVPGDCVLYDGHVELYVGNNKTIGHGDAKVDFSTPYRRSGFKGFYRYDFLD